MELSFNVWNRRERSGTREWVGFHIGIWWNNRGTHIVRIQTKPSYRKRDEKPLAASQHGFLWGEERSLLQEEDGKSACQERGPKPRRIMKLDSAGCGWWWWVFQHGSRVSLAGQKGSEAVGRWDEGSMTPLFWNWFDDLCLREPFGNGIFWMYSNFIIKPLIVVWIGRFLRIPQLQTTNWLFRRSWNLQDMPRTDWNESEPKGWKKKRWPWDDHQRVDELVSIQNLLKLLDEKVSCIKMEIFGWLGRLSTWQWRILKGGVAFGSWMHPFMFYRKEGRKIRILPTQSENSTAKSCEREISCLIWYINFPNASALHFAHFCLSCWLFVWSTRQPTNAQLRLGVEAIGNQSPRIDRISWTLNLET